MPAWSLDFFNRLTYTEMLGMNSHPPKTAEEYEKIWDDLLESPESYAMLERMIAEAALELGDELGASQENQSAEAPVAHPKGNTGSRTFGS